MTDARTGTDGREPPPPALELAEQHGSVEEAPRGPGWPILVFGVLWTGFVSGVQVLVIWHGEGMSALILLAFQVVGIGIILLGLSDIRSRDTLGWEGDRLCWRSRSPFRSRHRIWRRDEIGAIAVEVTVTRDSDGAGTSRRTAIVVRSITAELGSISWGSEPGAAIAAARRIAQDGRLPFIPPLGEDDPIPIAAAADAPVPVQPGAEGGWDLRPTGSVLRLVLGSLILGGAWIGVEMVPADLDRVPLLMLYGVLGIGMITVAGAVWHLCTRWEFRPGPRQWTVARVRPWRRRVWTIDPATVERIDLEPLGGASGHPRFMRLRVGIRDAQALRLAAYCDREALGAIGARLLAARDAGDQRPPQGVGGR